MTANFYPRPPRGGRRSCRVVSVLSCQISIHALREEGDLRSLREHLPQRQFLSTPSARRATGLIPISRVCPVFLSTPSARRATLQDCAQIYWLCISIHALREEGDFTEMPQTLAELQFLSTPSARRATQSCTLNLPCHENFYPRPPRGGRRFMTWMKDFYKLISIHALREEGDSGASVLSTASSKFLSTPSARRATHIKGGAGGVLLFLSTPSARRATPGGA